MLFFFEKKKAFFSIYPDYKGDLTYSLTLRVFNLTNIAVAQHSFGLFYQL